MQPLRAKSVVLILLTVALWGGTPVAVSYTLDELPPILVAALRFSLAAGFMIVWCRLEKTPLRIETGQAKPICILGLMLFAQISTFHLGVDWSNSSHTTLCVNTFIFWVLLIEHFVTRSDRLTPRKILGVLLAASGVALIIFFDENPASSRDPATLSGDGILLFSAFLLGIKIVYTRHALKTVESGKLIFWHDVIGVILLLTLSLACEEVAQPRWTWPVIAGLLYQGLVVAGLCFAIQAWLLRRHSASQISVFAFATPIFGVTFAVLIRGEPFSPWLLVAAVCVAVGILIVTLAQNARSPIGSRH